MIHKPAKIREFIKLLTIESIAAGIIFIISTLLFTFLANEMVIESEDLFDIYIDRIVSSHISPLNTRAATFVTFFGSEYFLIPAYILIIIYLIKKNRIRYSVLVTAVALISVFSGILFKEIFRRPRPFLPLTAAAGYSFPSGHSLAGFTFTGLLAWLVSQSSLSKSKKYLLITLFLFAGLLIGLSRIYLRVHFASDVLGSLLLTTSWLSLSVLFMRLLVKKFENEL